MENIPTWVPVVALALFNQSDEILLQKRPDGKHHAGLWEFPGGKVEKGETPRSSLAREIKEELGIIIQPDGLVPLGFAEETTDRHIVLFLYSTRDWVGELLSLEGQEFAWFDVNAAAHQPLAPMDRALLSRSVSQKTESFG